MLTSAPVSSTVPENSIPKTIGLNARLSIKPSTTEKRKAWSTGHPTCFLELRGLKRPPPPRPGKSVVPKAQESELKISGSQPEKWQQSYQFTNENFKNGQKHREAQVHKYFWSCSLGPWALYSTPVTALIILYLSVSVSPLVDYGALKDMNYIYSYSTWLNLDELILSALSSSTSKISEFNDHTFPTCAARGITPLTTAFSPHPACQQIQTEGNGSKCWDTTKHPKAKTQQLFCNHCILNSICLYKIYMCYTQ